METIPQHLLAFLIDAEAVTSFYLGTWTIGPIASPLPKPDPIE